jgi:hypothetical protein
MSPLGAGLGPESVCAVRYEGEEEEGDRMEGRRGMKVIVLRAMDK